MERKLASVLFVDLVDSTMMVRNTEPESFMPALDIAQMTQQYVHSRLFRS